MATQSIELFRGTTVIYVGEGRGGATASDEFFRAVDAGWDCVRIVELQPFPQCFERMFVLRRRTPSVRVA